MSRLDRLVTLIETGSTPFIRNTAADQLSDLAKQHPEDIISLLSRVYPFLQNSKWETRTTAARALGGIISHAPQWDPNSEEKIEEIFDDKIKQEKGNEEYEKIKKEEDDEKCKLEGAMCKYEEDLVTLNDFSLAEVLQSGIVLLASSGTEYNVFESGSRGAQATQDTAGSAKRRKTGFTTKLGFDNAKKPKPEIHTQVKQEDEKTKQDENLVKHDVAPVPSEPEPHHHVSARMRALAKRRAKAARSQSHRNTDVDLMKSSVSREISQEDTATEVKTVATTSSGYDVTSQAQGSKLVVETTPLIDEQSRDCDYAWQFQGIYELLVRDLFSESWEVRHGCAMGLRELIKYQATGAGRAMGKTREENNYRNRRTLEDLCVRLITLFTIDRFGDYVSDTVVAPVRENAGQVLAALLLHLPNETVLQTFNILVSLIRQDTKELGIQVPCWEAKHGGILGLKYFVSIRTDLLFTYPDLLDRTIEMVLYCLGNRGDDDVQSMAAATLIPITSEFVKMRSNVVFDVLNAIWNNLSDSKDDLSASTGSVMDLLAKLCLHKEVLEKMKEYAQENEQYKFKFLVPKLYPFLRHSISNVRKSVLKTLLAFLQIDDNSVKDWIDGKIFRLMFQNLLMEQNAEVTDLSMEVYSRLLEEVGRGGHGSMDDLFRDHWLPLLELLMTPIGVARFNYSMDTSRILRPSGSTLANSDIRLTGFNVRHKHQHKRKISSPDPGDNHQNKKQANGIPDSEYDLRVNIDAPVINGDLTLVSKEVLIRTRLAAATAMGMTLAQFENDADLEKVCKQMAEYIEDPHSTPRLYTAIVVDEYCSACSKSNKQVSEVAREAFNSTFQKALADPDSLPTFREFVPTLRGLRTQCLQLFGVFREVGKVSSSKLPTMAVVVEGERDAGPGAFGISTAAKLSGDWYSKLYKSMPAVYRMAALQPLEDTKHRINMGINEAKASKSARAISILASYASAFVKLNGLPKKLNPVIRSLMDSIKNEESLQLQSRSAISVAALIVLLHEGGKVGASDKMIKNLCAFLCVDTSEVPEFVPNKIYKDIVLSLKKEESKADPSDLAAADSEIHLAKIKRRGSKLALQTLLEQYTSDLFAKIPKIKSMMLDSLEIFAKGDSYEPTDKEGQAAIDSLELIRSLVGKLDKSLYSEVFDRVHLVLNALHSEYSVLRYSASKCFGSMCATAPSIGFQTLVKDVLPMLSNPLEVNQRQGAIECIYHIASLLGSDILPYVVFLIVPVMGRMSDSDDNVRILATTTFASIIKLVPLEAGIPDPPDMPKDLLVGREKERDFIQQMMDPTKIKPFELRVGIEATLRKYQQEGVNWLAFLNRYHLHGILCDDMGLGKTLQTICIVASDHHLRMEKFVKTGASDSRPLPSLIVCPPSLTGHWEQEFAHFAPFMKVLVYAGPPSVRAELRPKMREFDVIVTSYDVVRNDIEYVTQTDYNYCVLDEGHIIKNAHSRLTIAVKRITAEHRLILTGTPIQNNVLELWSLFDFLMPGFLGTEKAFHDKFVKPIASSRTNKGNKEQEAGALALETLHKQVLPFMLRRLKEDVLSDLPPKIIQDYYCELSSLQKQLYQDFVSKQKGAVKKDLSDDTDKKGKQHIFQALQYMRKLCNSPALVVTPKHPQYKEVKAYLHKYNMDIRDIHHAPKLMALKNLLKECGIGLSSGSGGDTAGSAELLQEDVISQHRALIFCQMKDMLDIVENDLLKKRMPSVTYMRMDGSTDPRYRQEIVRKFNNDPSIDVLLLTTKVGGLGLNLTGADTVIFVEHDWNPMNDLQAMDRAHRIGQKKVVNVYRLITKDTLEEKIMGLQKFKLNIANTVVNQQNAGLSSMDAGQLLDLFDEDAKRTLKNGAEAEEQTEGEGESEEGKKPSGAVAGKDVPNEVGLSGKAGNAVKDLGELWDESQYEEEYNLDSFIKTLK
ncbi:DEKNAAC102618 [Brettanomyces naardenensis]|uniref:TATA-binding protein-associated factor mot1 n=1 Tax=Brettanomyces naardenensis TaxID=13370 RepID=A0A448YKF1_BRENA|nr:DEKNAAC102618 [Brettanomyces naardenensis]